jgi:hypothetical protein
MHRSILSFIVLLGPHMAIAQIINTAAMDSADYKVKGKVTVEGYVDAYYSYNFNKPVSGDQPYLVSMSRHNEININLAFVDVKYSSSRVRARVVPGFGTYVNMNYRQESGSLKNLIEANAGVKLFRDKAIWVDVGVLGSPYTNESAISKDHLAYTRSLSAENVPYYLSGVKLTVPVSRKVNTYFYVINGWQQITDQNNNKSIGSQVEIRPNNNLLVNWNNYLGKESTAKDSTQGIRYFTDLYFIFSKNNLSMTGSAYYGIQENREKLPSWWQVNLISRYTITPNLSAALRLEYFEDKHQVIIVPVTPTAGFETFGISAGINVKIEENILFRTEARHFISNDKVYSNNGIPTSKSFTLTGSLCAWF